jgi:hypothetical protein
MAIPRLFPVWRWSYAITCRSDAVEIRRQNSSGEEVLRLTVLFLGSSLTHLGTSMPSRGGQIIRASNAYSAVPSGYTPHLPKSGRLKGVAVCPMNKQRAGRACASVCTDCQAGKGDGGPERTARRVVCKPPNVCLSECRCFFTETWAMTILPVLADQNERGVRISRCT